MSLKSGRLNPPCPPDQSKNKLTNIPSTSLHTKTNSQKKVVKTTKKKVTMPSPTVVSQASALPNALPVKYLTQFSVLLQVSKFLVNCLFTLKKSTISKL